MSYLRTECIGAEDLQTPGIVITESEDDERRERVLEHANESTGCQVGYTLALITERERERERGMKLRLLGRRGGKRRRTVSNAQGPYFVTKPSLSTMVRNDVSGSINAQRGGSTYSA